MNAMEVLVFGGLALYIIATQVGRHPITLRRFLMPLIIVAAVALIYLKGIPTAGGDLPFDGVCILIGLGFGLLAASLMHIERDGQNGTLMLEAGIDYAAVWVIVFGGRLAFGWAASSFWRSAVGQFSMAHAITGEAAWTAAFVLMSVAMIGARTAVLALRTLQAGQQSLDIRPALT